MGLFHLLFLKASEIKDAIHASPAVATFIDTIPILIQESHIPNVATIIPSMLLQLLPVLMVDLLAELVPDSAIADLAPKLA